MKLVLYSFIGALVSLLYIGVAYAANYNERDFNPVVCSEVGGVETKHRAGAKWLRPDCEDREYAYEADWGYKMYEAIGQSLVYAKVSGKKPAILFYIRTEKSSLEKKDWAWYQTFKSLDMGIHHRVFRVNRETGEWGEVKSARR